MKLKYQDEITKLTCELNDFCNVSKRAFRWTFEDINDWRNFEPVYILDPNRPRNTCLGYALSFFENKNSGITRYKQLTSAKGNLYKKLGTHIAEGTLCENDGISGITNNSFHFDFFCYEGVDLSSKFEILEQIT